MIDDCACRQYGLSSNYFDHLFKFGASEKTLNHVFEMDEARQFKFGVAIDTEESQCMCDRLMPKEMCSTSRELFKFRAITDNMS